MPWSVQAKLEGLETPLRKLATLRKPATRTRVLRRALDKASQPVAKTMKQLAPVSEEPPLIPGLLRKSIGRRVKTYRGSGVVVVIVGPRAGFKRQVGVRKSGKNAGRPVFQNPTQYAHLVEYGHGGPRPAPPHPFARPAWDRHKATARDETARLIREGVEAEARRA